MKLRKYLGILITLLLVVAPLAACSAKPTPAPATPEPTKKAVSTDIKPVAFTPVDQLPSSVSQALGGFSLDLFQRVTAKANGQNVFLSPLSVWLALSMTYNGASGSTALGMAQALHATDLSIDELNKANAGLMGVLTAADPKVKIAIANSLWLRQDLAGEFNQDFLDRDQTYYAAEINKLNFADAGAADKINSWVSKNTNGNIKKLIDPPIDSSTVLFLINAIHFKAPWKTAFDPKATRDGVFTTTDGKEVAAKFLFKEEGNFGYFDESVTAARIPYASGRLEMVAILPQQQTLSDFVKGLTAQKLQTIIDNCKETPMTLSFPKFKLEYGTTLNDALIAMGMKDAFDGSVARFENMSKSMGDILVISQVKHKSFIEVNEEGTEASAATSVEIRATAMPMALDFSKPFVYLIRDSKTGAILFIGTMESPA